MIDECENRERVLKFIPTTEARQQGNVFLKLMSPFPEGVKKLVFHVKIEVSHQRYTNIRGSKGKGFFWYWSDRCLIEEGISSGDSNLCARHG